MTADTHGGAPSPAADWDWPGSRWWRCDLHIHSPASYDFTDRETVTFDDLAQAAMDAGLQAIAITDHNTADGVEEVTRAGAGLSTPVVVYPGVEITTKEGAHLLVLFAPGTAADAIKGFLGDCGVAADKWGTKEAIATEAYADCVTKAADKHRALCIAAHADRAASGGKHPTSLLEVIKPGQPLNAILKLPTLHAVEVTADDADVLKKLRGEDARTKRPLRPCVWGSDAHALNQVGQASTWIKMTRPDSQGLRLALADGESSVLQHEGSDPNEYSLAVVESITIENTKLIGTGEPFELRFNPWLNAIIGGRGTGKSSVIEFLRLALRREDELPPSLAGTFEDLARSPDPRSDKGLLRTNSRITVIYRKDDVRFRITWPDSSSAISEQLPDGSWVPAAGEVVQRFPIRLYSQKQVFELAQDPAALLTVVDDSSAVAKANWDRDWREAENEFLARRARLREVTENLADESRLRGELDDLQKRLAVFEKSKHSEVLATFRKRRSQAAAIDAWEANLSQLSLELSEQAAVTLATFDHAEFDESDEADAELLEAMRKEQESVAKVRKQIEAASASLKTQLDGWAERKARLIWTREDSAATDSYNELLKRLEEENAGSPEEYADLVDQRVELAQRVSALEERKQERDKLEEQSHEALEKLHKLRRELTERRTTFVENVLAGNRHVQITVCPFGDKDDAEATLRALLGRETEFQNDISTSDGRGLLDQLFAGDEVSEADVDGARSRLIACASGQEPGWEVRDHRFVEHLRSLQPETRDRLAFWTPQDSLEVAYSRAADGTDFEPIGRGSPGEKTAAILAFLLSYGDEPIVLDQPEDDLDNRLIYDLIVEQLKENKKRRQIIVVTHNANIVVNGDSEFIASLDFKAGHTLVVESGGLQEENVREEICSVMEGGRAAFEQRYQRIGRPPQSR